MTKRNRKERCALINIILSTIKEIIINCLENQCITSEIVSEFSPFTFGAILIDPPQPETPGNVQISIIDSTVNIEWTEVSGVSFYSIYSSENPYSETWNLEQTGIIDTTWSDSILNLKK